jgi:predicted transglutaminase-like cysteine proteinase
MRHSIAAPLIGNDIPAPVQNSITELGPTLSPFQHVRFCRRYPSDCQPDPQAAALVELDSKTANLLSRINRQVNAAIVPTRKDVVRDVGAAWAVAPHAGDCNDYAVTKQHELLQYKLPASALRLSEVKTADWEGHLVLVVATTKGELVLDNLTDEIRPWEDTDYRWLKIQSKTDPHYWVEMRSPIIVPATIREVFRKIAAAAQKIGKPAFQKELARRFADSDRRTN